MVSKYEWLAARRAHLAKDKEFTRLRDQLSRERRELPWVRVDKEYLFDGPKGRESLSDQFEGRSQLIVYHFIYGPDWKEGSGAHHFMDIAPKGRDEDDLAYSMAWLHRHDEYVD